MSLNLFIVPLLFIILFESANTYVGHNDPEQISPHDAGRYSDGGRPLLDTVGIKATEEELPRPVKKKMRKCRGLMKARIGYRDQLKPIKKAMRKYIKFHCKAEKFEMNGSARKLATVEGEIGKVIAAASAKARRFNVYAGVRYSDARPVTPKAQFLTAVQCLMGLAAEEINDFKAKTGVTKARRYRDSHPGCFRRTPDYNPSAPPEPTDGIILPPPGEELGPWIETEVIVGEDYVNSDEDFWELEE